MNKLKTRKSAKKRFRKTTNDNFVRKKAFRGHLLEKKSSRRKRNLSRYAQVSFTQTKSLYSMLPYL